MKLSELKTSVIWRLKEILNGRIDIRLTTVVLFCEVTEEHFKECIWLVAECNTVDDTLAILDQEPRDFIPEEYASINEAMFAYNKALTELRYHITTLLVADGDSALVVAALQKINNINNNILEQYA